MVYTGRLISFYRLFDLNSLVEVAHYMSYKQIACGIILGHSKSGNQHLKFLQHSVANYLIPDILKSNWTKLKIPYIHYKFESNIDGDIGFKIIGNKFQNNESNIGTLDGLFGIINFLEKSVNDVESRDEAKAADKVERPVINVESRDEAKAADKVEKPVNDVESRDEAKAADKVEKPVINVESRDEAKAADEVERPVNDVKSIVTGEEELKSKSNLPSPTFPDDEVIFRTKLKEIIAKVDSVLEKKEEVERLKQSKKIDEIARKLDEFRQKNILAKQSNEAENPKIEPEKVYSLVVYQSAKHYKLNHYNNVKNPIKLLNSTPHVQNDKQNNALVLYKNVNQEQGHKGIEKTQFICEALTYGEINVCPNNYQQLIGERRLRDFRDNNFPYGDEKIQDNWEIKEDDKKKLQIVPILIHDGKTAKFYLGKDKSDFEDGGDGNSPRPPPHPPRGGIAFLSSWSGKIEYNPIKKHIFTIFVANLGLNIVRQPFFQELINKICANMYSINDVYELLPTLSFDFIYDYFLAYEGGRADNLLNNILESGAFWVNLPEQNEVTNTHEGGIEKMEQSINETNLQIEQEDGNSVNQNKVTNTHEGEIEKMEESINVSKEETKQKSPSCFGCFKRLFTIFSRSKDKDKDPEIHVPEANQETNENTDENTDEKDCNIYNNYNPNYDLE